MTNNLDAELEEILHDYSEYVVAREIDRHTPPDWAIDRDKAKSKLKDLIAKERADAIINARAKDPLECEYGHKVYAHRTAEGWCCACDADIAFLEAQLNSRK